MALSVGRPLKGTPRTGPTVSVLHQPLALESISFATELAGGAAGKDFFFLFENASAHPQLPGKPLQSSILKSGENQLARGERIGVPEWKQASSALPDGLRKPACFVRKGSIFLLAVFEVPASRQGKSIAIQVTPMLDGSSTPLTVVKRDITFPKRASNEFAVKFKLGGQLPDDVGEHELVLKWEVDGIKLVVFGGNDSWIAVPSLETGHRIFTVFGPPFLPHFLPAPSDQPDKAFLPDMGGVQAPAEEGTVSGTEARFRIFSQLIGPDRRHLVATPDDLVDLHWQLHKGINNSTPPFFHGGNDNLLTTVAFPEWTEKPRSEWPEAEIVPLTDQWLMWARSKPEFRKVNGRNLKRRWNDASCIGHAQLHKTMAQAFGLESHLCWVFPHTTRLPKVGDAADNVTARILDAPGYVPGMKVSYDDLDLFATDADPPNANRQFWVRPHEVPVRFDRKTKTFAEFETKDLTFFVALMRANAKGDFEHFEGCLKAGESKAAGRFLTGGFALGNMGAGSNATKKKQVAAFKKHKGFPSATELLSWWTTLEEDGRPRFLAWVHLYRFIDPDTRAEHRVVYFMDRHDVIYTDASWIAKGNSGLEWAP